MKSNLFTLKRQLEMQTGRAYSWAEIAKLADLNANTVYSLANNRLGGVQYSTLSKLLEFFRREGLDIEVGDLFAVEEAA